MRFTRSSLLEALQQDYVRTARAKGLAERRVVWRHALRNALIPVVTVVGSRCPPGRRRGPHRDRLRLAGHRPARGRRRLRARLPGDHGREPRSWPRRHRRQSRDRSRLPRHRPADLLPVSERSAAPIRAPLAGTAGRRGRRAHAGRRRAGADPGAVQLLQPVAAPAVEAAERGALAGHRRFRTGRAEPGDVGQPRVAGDRLRRHGALRSCVGPRWGAWRATSGAASTRPSCGPPTCSCRCRALFLILDRGRAASAPACSTRRWSSRW